jgi:hypothetical protein
MSKRVKPQTISAIGFATASRGDTADHAWSEVKKEAEAMERAGLPLDGDEAKRRVRAARERGLGNTAEHRRRAGRAKANQGRHDNSQELQAELKRMAGEVPRKFTTARAIAFRVEKRVAQRIKQGRWRFRKVGLDYIRRHVR